MNFCPNCGAKQPRPGEDQFCMNCGFKLPTPQGEAPAASAAPATPVAPEAPAPAATQGFVAQAPAARPAVVNPPKTQSPPAPTTASFAGVPVSPAPGKEVVAKPAAPQPRGEDLLNMIVDAQSPASAPPQDLFTGAKAPDDLFADGPATASPKGGDLFADAGKAPAGQPNMFDTTILQNMKPPQAAEASHLGAAPTVAKADLFDAAAPPPAADGQPDLFAANPVEEPFEFPTQPEPMQAPGEAPLAQQPLDSEFDTAALLAGGDGAGGDSLFDGGAQNAADAKRAFAPERPAKPEQPASPRQAKARPMREHSYDTTQSMRATKPQPQKPTAAPPPVTLPEPDVIIKKPSVIGRVLTGVAILLIFLVVCACTVLVMLYFQNRPARAIDNFIELVADADTEALAKTRVVDQNQMTVSVSAEQWAAFCEAFTQKSSQNELKSQLLMMADEETGVEYSYAAVTITSKPFLLFIEEYSIQVQLVSMVAPGAAQGTVARLNDVDYTGQPVEGGELYEGLMPGRYQIRLVPPGVDFQNVPAEDIEIFGVDGPNTLEGEAPRVEISISNCVSDDAILYVNDQPINEKPIGGTVTIPNVALGSTIRISAIQDGMTMGASVVFSDLNTTQLAFGEYNSEGEAAPASSESTEDADISESDINALLGTFYQSYLTCINQQSMDSIQGTTSEANASLGTRIQSDGNASNVFEYISASCDASSIRTTSGGAVQFNAAFTYNYKPRDSEEAYTQASNYQSVELVQQDGNWLVNKMTFVSEGDFNNHVLANFE